MICKKELVCQAFVTGVWEDATNTGEMIAKQIREQGLTSSLEDHTCLSTLAAEWFFARLIWLQLKAKEIQDLELRKFFLAEIATNVNNVLRLIPDLEDLRASYLVMAMMHEKGELDPAGLPYRPGPFISKRYANHVAAIKTSGAGTPQCSDEAQRMEGMLITLLGDKTCWYLQNELNPTLLEILAADA